MSATETTRDTGAKVYSGIATILMIALVAYGALSLLGVIR
jgi:hypothetical protein